MPLLTSLTHNPPIQASPVLVKEIRPHTPYGENILMTANVL